uniref:CUE domain containing 2 n=1 Tax=Pelusios castaneus TaxID=367368 RepID=A0A8C8SR41_9SAUR
PELAKLSPACVLLVSSGMDEVVLSYIAGVLEELGSPELCKESFDMDTFVEMMEAYVPGFMEINRGVGTICDMMFALSERLSDARSKGKQPTPSSGRRSAPTPGSRFSSSEAEEEHLAYWKLIVLLSCIQPLAAFQTLPMSVLPDQGAGGDLKEGAELLLEMFPACTLSQAQKALAMTLGNLEEAVQVMVEEKVGAIAAFTNPRLRFRYMMVDSEEDQKTHRPVPPKEAPKKLIRYIDNQVVSTKGERYKDIKKPESKEMKRTYISLKPARKYKFH